MLHRNIKLLLFSAFLNIVFVVTIIYIGSIKTDFFKKVEIRLGLIDANKTDRPDYWCIRGWNNTIEKLRIDFDVCFFGNSITCQSDFGDVFYDMTICNLGYPGDDLEGMLLRVPAVAGACPKKIFVMAGINDLLSGAKLDDFEREYAFLIQNLVDSLPTSQIYLQSILPVNNEDFEKYFCDNDRIICANSIIKQIAGRYNCYYIDLHSAYYLDGKMRCDMSKDGLHLNRESYNIWAELIRPYVYDLGY